MFYAINIVKEFNLYLTLQMLILDMIVVVDDQEMRMSFGRNTNGVE